MRIENEPLMDRFKLNVPTLHLDTIGAGAGMILKVDPLTRKVSLGPESAGADPGPAAYPALFFLQIPHHSSDQLKNAAIGIR